MGVHFLDWPQSKDHSGTVEQNKVHSRDTLFVPSLPSCLHPFFPSAILFLTFSLSVSLICFSCLQSCSPAVLFSFMTTTSTNKQTTTKDLPRGIFAGDGSLLHAGADIHQRIERVLAGLVGTDDLDQLHLGDGVEEMETTETIRPLGGLGNLADGEGRGVGAEEGVLGSDLVEHGEQLLLGLQVLDDGLDDQISILGGGLRVGTGLDLGHGLVDEGLLLGSILRELLLGDTLEGGGDDVLTLLESLGVEVNHGDVEGVLGGDLDNTGAHETGAKDGDVLDVVGGIGGGGGGECRGHGHGGQGTHHGGGVGRSHATDSRKHCCKERGVREEWIEEKEKEKEQEERKRKGEKVRKGEKAGVGNSKGWRRGEVTETVGRGRGDRDRVRGHGQRRTTRQDRTLFPLESRVTRCGNESLIDNIFN